MKKFKKLENKFEIDFHFFKENLNKILEPGKPRKASENHPYLKTTQKLGQKTEKQVK
jgi:hypothetical protein